MVDISTPDDPTHVTLIPSTQPRYMAAQGNFGYLCDGVGLRILNMTDVESPVEVATYNPGPVRHFSTYGSVGYLSTYGDGIHVLNISNPLAPVSICNYTQINATITLQTQKVGNFLFALEYGSPFTDYGIQIINATDPEDLVFMSRITSPTPYAFEEMYVSGNFIYAHGIGTLSIISIETSILTPEVVAEIPVEWFLDGHMVFWDGYIYGASNTGGFQMIDVSNPADPRYDFIQTIGGSCQYSWIAIFDTFIYSNGGSTEIEVYELHDALTATAQSLRVVEAADGTVITEATLTVDATIPGSTNIVYSLSVDNGSTWNQVSPGITETFTTYSRYLLWRAVLATSIATVTPEISSFDISVKILRVPPEIISIDYSASYNKPFFIFNQDEGMSILHIDTEPTFDSPNFRNFTTKSVSGVVSGFGVLISTPSLDNGTWYYRTAGIDGEGDIGLWSEVEELQIGTTTGVQTGIQDLIILLAIVGAIGVVVILIVVFIRKRGS